MNRMIAALGFFLALATVPAVPTMVKAQEQAPERGMGKMRPEGPRRGFGGRIKSIDKEKHTIVIENRRMGEVTIQFTDETKFSKDGEPIKLSDLKEGDLIQAGGEVNEEKKTVKATDVMVRTARPMRAPDR